MVLKRGHCGSRRYSLSHLGSVSTKRGEAHIAFVQFWVHVLAGTPVLMLLETHVGNMHRSDAGQRSRGVDVFILNTLQALASHSRL